MSNKIKPNWKAAFFCKCPTCGKGKIFKGQITIKNSCPECGADFTRYELADGPAFFAICIIGTIVCFGAGIMEVIYEPSAWVQLAIWLPITFFGSFWIIRVSKTLMIAHQMTLK